jgi:hypothetical protein
LRIVCHGSAKDLKDFYGSSKALLDSNGFSFGEMSHVQELLSICNFAASKSVATYSELAAHLGISEDEVEIWIVEAISHGLIEANMNQLSATVSIKYVASYL